MDGQSAGMVDVWVLFFCDFQRLSFFLRPIQKALSKVGRRITVSPKKVVVVLTVLSIDINNF
jgi:hypothetical protein